MQASRLETCEFISAYICELSKLAANAGLPTLTYLLDIAQLEVDNAAIAETKQQTAA